VTPILRVTRATSYEKRAAITEAADSTQDEVIASVLTSGFRINWTEVERESDGAGEPLPRIEAAIRAQLDGPDFAETVQALDVNGRMLAAFVQRQHERASGLILEPVIAFAEPVFTPERAVAYWTKKLGLDEETAARVLANLRRGDHALFGLKDRIARSVMDRIASLFKEAIAQGLSPAEFPRKLREIPTPKGWSGGLERVTDAVIETEYRTNLSEVYNESAHELVVRRADTFPFLQFMAIRDSRVTWWICGAMGTAVNGRGYIVATDDPLPMTVWRLPAHYRCRSCWSPISYLEAQRLGILAKDGRTKIALVGGNPARPFGDPPEFATNPDTGETRRVEPQAGFGA